jgi:hypothetical protein
VNLRDLDRQRDALSCAFGIVDVDENGFVRHLKSLNPWPAEQSGVRSRDVFPLIQIK